MPGIWCFISKTPEKTAFQPYHRWFDGRYGEQPSYCPAGPWAFVVTTNYQSGASPMYNPAEDSPAFNPDFDPNRFYPDATGQRMFVDTIVDNVAALELDAFGSWASTLHSRYLTPDGSSNEYNPNIELIDPNIDFGRDFSLVSEYTAAHAAVDFVKHHGGNIAAVRRNDLDREAHARQLAARCDLGERLCRLPRIRADPKFDLVDAPGFGVVRI